MMSSASAPSGYGWKYLDFLPRLNPGLERIPEADVFAGHVDVHESAKPSVLVGEALAQLAVLLEQRVEHGADGLTVDLHRALASGGVAQLSRELDGDAHAATT